MKIQVRVKPNSKTEEIIVDGDVYVVRVKEPPKEGKANRAVVRLLSEHFHVPRSSVTITVGLSSRNKVVEIADE
jgi:uncharacterized protein (TIGR00251 family)